MLQTCVWLLVLWAYIAKEDLWSCCHSLLSGKLSRAFSSWPKAELSRQWIYHYLHVCWNVMHLFVYFTSFHLLFMIPEWFGEWASLYFCILVFNCLTEKVLGEKDPKWFNYSNRLSRLHYCPFSAACTSSPWRSSRCCYTSWEMVSLTLSCWPWVWGSTLAYSHMSISASSPSRQKETVCGWTSHNDRR